MFCDKYCVLASCDVQLRGSLVGWTGPLAACSCADHFSRRDEVSTNCAARGRTHQADNHGLHGYWRWLLIAVLWWRVLCVDEGSVYWWGFCVLIRVLCVDEGSVLMTVMCVDEGYVCWWGLCVLMRVLCVVYGFVRWEGSECWRGFCVLMRVLCVDEGSVCWWGFCVLMRILCVDEGSVCWWGFCGLVRMLCVDEGSVCW